MTPLIVVCVYLGVVAVIGAAAYRRGLGNTEDFFLASRGLGSVVFFLSLFATNMTAFSILGSSGQAYHHGIGVYGLMASSSGLVIPLSIFFLGTRLWAVGRRFGFQTPVQFYRARWECDHIGTVIFAITVILLVPYMIISIMGGGRVLHDISGGILPYAIGCALVALVVTVNVFFGGLRGAVWVNIFQTILFLLFGTIALAIISQSVQGGLSEQIQRIAQNPETKPLLTRENLSQRIFWSYSLIPLSSIMFPHMAIMCFAAKTIDAFKKTVVLYPLAIMAVWLPCVYLGVIGTQTEPGLKNSDGVLLQMLSHYAPAWIAGILGAGIISAVLGSDTHQVLAASTLFTKDLFNHYGGHEKFGESKSVLFARVFILVVTCVAYLVALITPMRIFELAVRFAFSGFAALSLVLVAALFWRRSTKYGALAVALWVGISLAGLYFLQKYSDSIAPMPGQPPVPIFPALGSFLERSASQITFYGFLPVVPMLAGSAVLMTVVSLLTKQPSKATIEKFFPSNNQ